MPIFSATPNSLLAHKLLSPPPLGTIASPQNLPELLLDSPSGGVKDLPFRSVFSRLPCQTLSQKGQEGRGPMHGAGVAVSATRFAASRRRALRSSQRGLSGAPSLRYRTPAPGLPAFPGNGQAGSQWRGPSLQYLHRPAPFFHPPSPPEASPGRRVGSKYTDNS